MKIKITSIMSMSEECYEEHFIELKKEILSGKFQRDLMKDGNKKGLKKVNATFEIIKQ